jgi:hypothetical protein
LSPAFATYAAQSPEPTPAPAAAKKAAPEKAAERAPAPKQEAAAPKQERKSPFSFASFLGGQTMQVDQEDAAPKVGG